MPVKHSQFAPRSKPSPKTKGDIYRIINNRQRGFFQTKDMKDEAELCMRQMTPTDVCFTHIMRMGVFNVYSKKELQGQIETWKELKVVLHKYNVFPRKYRNKTYYACVVQPSQEEALDDCPMCPLALSLGIMCSGYTYVFQNYNDVDNLITELGGSREDREVDSEEEDDSE